MAYPIPLISESDGARFLSDLYVRTETACPDPDGRPPALLVSMPTAWTNKYQLLLYKRAARHRFAVAGVTVPDALEYVSWPGPVVLHAHWFAASFAGVHSETAAMARLEQVIDMVERFKSQNDAKLLWTAHNVFPHGNRFPETFLALRQWIFRTFDAVHLMNDGHLALLEDTFGVPPRATFTVPHMLYTGAMPGGVDRLAARAQFGFPHDARVFGYFGSIQGYKGLGRLVESLLDLADRSDRPIRGLIGGIPSDTAVVRELQQQLGTRQDIRFLPRQIRDHEVPVLHAASDMMVLPYENTLNSGAALMAATFGIPFLMPRGSASAGLESLGARTYDPDDPGALAAALADTSVSAPPADPEAWRLREPDTVSDAFFRAVSDLLDDEPGGP